MVEKNKSAEATVRNILRKTRKKYSAEEKIRIVLDGLRGESTIADQKAYIREAP
jgi:transposase